MRKSTLVAMAIIAVLGVLLLYPLYMYTDQFVEEIAHAKELTAEFQETLAPDTKIKLARVRGGARYVVHDVTRPGLLLEASPSERAWAGDPSGFGFARPVALRLFDAYGPDRPIRWIQFRLCRPDGTPCPVFGLEPAEAGGLAAIEDDVPPSSPPSRPPPSPPAPTTKPVAPIPPPGPGGPATGK